MDKDTIFLMLDNIKKSGLLGPKTSNNYAKAIMGFALDKKADKKVLNTGSFIVTEKGNNLLENKTSWDSL